MSENQFAKVVDDLAEMCDYVLIDCPAGIEHGFRNAVAGAREAIIVTTPEVSAIRDADRVIGKLNERGLPMRLIVNRMRPEMVRSGDMLSVDDVCEILSAELLGIVPDDEEIIDTTNRGEPIVLDADVGSPAIYDKIARRLEGEIVPFTQLRRTGVPRPFARRERQVGPCTSLQRQMPAPRSPPRRAATRGRAIVVTSGKGGVGKTTTTANLGVGARRSAARASCWSTPTSVCATSTSCSASRAACATTCSTSSRSNATSTTRWSATSASRR